MSIKFGSYESALKNLSFKSTSGMYILWNI